MRNVIKGPNVTWIDIENPTRDDVSYLENTFGIIPLTTKSITTPEVRSRVELYPNYLYLVLHYPVHNKQSRETRSRELDIIATKDTIITVRLQSIVTLKSLYNNLNIYEEERAKYMNQGAGYLLFAIIEDLWESSLTKLTRINKGLGDIEKEIFEGREGPMVEEISLTKADIINFWKIVSPQTDTMAELRKEGVEFFGSEMRPYFSHLLTTCHYIQHDLSTFKESISALEETNNSLLTYKTNQIVELLTMFSVIVFPLTLIAGIFGMNTDYLPIVGARGDFWIIFTAMLIGTLLMVAYFKKRGWI